jgi:hemerythrin-like domain-containing protein
MEERVLFPGFEAKTGQTMGPTQVMRAEHVQMRDLMGQMQAALAAEHEDTYLGLSETLNMLMQQHNLKEENVLYPMADRVLAAERDGLIGRMDDLENQ